MENAANQQNPEFIDKYSIFARYIYCTRNADLTTEFFVPESSPTRGNLGDLLSRLNSGTKTAIFRRLIATSIFYYRIGYGKLGDSYRTNASFFQENFMNDASLPNSQVH